MKEVDELLEVAMLYYSLEDINRVQEAISSSIHKYRVYYSEKEYTKNIEKPAKNNIWIKE